MAPFRAQQYELYDANDEVGKPITLVGYGLTGQGATGARPGTGNTKRQGNNRFDANANILRNEVQLVNSPGDTAFSVMYNGVRSENVPAHATDAQGQAALETIPALRGNVRVSRFTGIGESYYVSFINGLADTPVLLLTSDVTGVEIERQIRGGTNIGPPSGSLVYDFDDGDVLRDAFGLLYGIHDLGLPGGDALDNFGDSGGPLFIDGRIAGVFSEFGTIGNRPPDLDGIRNNATFGEINWATRVSSNLNGFINPTVNAGAYDLVLDMTTQVLGRSRVGDKVTITARRNGLNLELAVSGPNLDGYDGLYYSAPAAGIRSLTIRGSDDDETIRLEGALGVGPITVMGRGGDDTVIVGTETGGNLSDLGGLLTVDGGDGANSLFINDVGAAAAQSYAVTGTTVDRTGAPQILYSKINKLTLNAGSSGDTIDVKDTGSLATLTINGDSGGDDIYVRATSAGTTTAVNGGDGADTITVGSTGNTLDDLAGPLTVKGDSDTDSLNVNDQGTTVDRSYTVTPTTVRRTGGVDITYDTIENLTLNAGSGGDRISVPGTNQLMTTVINAGGGDDLITAGSNSKLDDLVGRLTVNGGPGYDQLYLDDVRSVRQGGQFYTVTDTTVERAGTVRITYALLDLLELDAGRGGNTVVVRSTNVLTTTVIDPGVDTDVVNVGSENLTLDDIMGPLSILGSGADELSLNDRGTNAGRTFVVGASTVDRNLMARITYSSLAQLTLNGGGGGNTITVQGTARNTDTYLNSGSGADAIYVRATGPGALTAVAAESSDDVIEVGNAAHGLDDLAGNLDVEGGSGTDALTLHDEMTGAGQTFSITAGGVYRADGRRVFYGTVESLKLNGGAFGNTVTVKATASGTATQVNAGAGDDTVNLGSDANTLDDIAAPLIVVGGTGTDALNVNDQGSVAAGQYTVSATIISRDGTSFSAAYGGFENLTLNGGSGGNTINVRATAAGTATRVNAGAGDDTIKVASGAPNPNRLDDILGALTIDGQGGANNQIFIDDSGSPGPRTYRISGDAVRRAGGPTINTLNYRRRVLTTDAASTVVQVVSALTGTELQINTGGGDDRVVLGSDDNRLDDVRGTVAVSAGGGNDLLQINDQGYDLGENYRLAANGVGVGRLPDLQLTYSGVESLALNAGSGNDAVRLESIDPSLGLLLDPGAGYDRLVVASGQVATPQLQYTNLERLEDARRHLVRRHDERRRRHDDYAGRDPRPQQRRHRRPPPDPEQRRRRHLERHREHPAGRRERLQQPGVRDVRRYQRRQRRRRLGSGDVQQRGHVHPVVPVQHDDVRRERIVQ